MKTFAKWSQNDLRPTPQRSQMDPKPIPDQPQNQFQTKPISKQPQNQPENHHSKMLQHATSKPNPTDATTTPTCSNMQPTCNHHSNMLQHVTNSQNQPQHRSNMHPQNQTPPTRLQIPNRFQTNPKPIPLFLFFLERHMTTRAAPCEFL